MTLYSKKDFTILVDMDDTIENLIDAWVIRINEEFGTKTKRKDIINWDIDTFFPSITKAQVFSVLFEHDFWKTVKPKKDAIKYLEKLHDEGFNILLCTASHYSTVKEKFEDALLPYFPFFDSDHIIITNQKYIIKADVLVDDGVHNLLKGSYKKILYTTSVNKNFDEEKKYKIERVSNWKQVYDTIERMYEDELEKHKRKKEKIKKTF